MLALIARAAIGVIFMQGLYVGADYGKAVCVINCKHLILISELE